MSRGRLVGLAAVLLLLVAALVVGARDRSTGTASSDAAPAPDLTALRTAAALAPCPSGLSPALPDLTLACVGAAGDVRMQGAPGRPTLVNVWGTWCPPCVREVPLLQSLHTRTDAVDVVGVLTEDTVEHALQFAADPAVGGMTYASVDDPQGTVMRRYGSGPPITLFVTAEGKVAFVQRGEITSRPALDALVQRHLGVRL